MITTLDAVIIAILIVVSVRGFIRGMGAKLE
jgi:uncharacterized membrane protein required for colicin V production